MISFEISGNQANAFPTGDKSTMAAEILFELTTKSAPNIGSS